MKKLFLLLPLFLMLCACSKKEGPSFNIYHTNDIQGFYWARNYAENENKETGGISILKEMFDKQPEGSYLLFDSGDSFSKTQEGQIGKLSGALELMNKLKYTAATLSHNDFALGWEPVEAALAKANFPVVVSNIETSEGAVPNHIKKYIFIERQKVKIAVVGLVSKADFPRERRNSQIKVLDEVQTLKTLIPQLQEEGAQIIILLSSLGFDLQSLSQTPKTDEKTLAEEFPEINLILGGNADLSPQGFEEISGVHISRAAPMLFEVEKITLSLDKNLNPVSYKHEDIVLDKAAFGEDEEMAQAVAETRAAVKRITGRRISTLATPMESYPDKQSPLGVYTADCIRRWASNDIGIINSDLFLSNFEQGQITEVDLLNSIPFNDRVMLVKMRGDELKNALEHTLAFKNNWPQTANIEVFYDPQQPVGSKIKKITLNGNPLKNDLVYTISTSDHIVAGGFGHNEFLNVFEFKNTDRPVRDIVRWCIYRTKGEVSAPKTDQWKIQK